MVDASDDFKVDEHFQNAPIDEEDRLKAEKRAAKVKAKEAKQADKEAKEEQRKINRENREKKKKLKDKNKKRKRGEEVSDDEEEQGDAEKTGGDGSKKAKKEKPAEEHGVWVGNLAFATSQDGLRRYFEDCGEITRIKCPKGEGRQKQNKGFAYVMFKEQDSIEKAIAKSEEKLDGRPLLIKNAKSFERKDGLPKPTKTSVKQKNPPCPTLFIGNLSFDTTKESLQEHFSWAGDIRQVRLGTFQDSGKCKGFGYVDYVTVESATKAIRAPDKHTLHERKVRVEFASEEAHRRSMPWMIRREKADQRADNDTSGAAPAAPAETSSAPASEQSNDQHQYRPRKEYTPREGNDYTPRERREKKPKPQGHLKPGEALSNAQRQKPSVQEFKGTKITFD
ncbi:hypothetical protein BCR42DRAFT_353030 [Absidia repens]|uniref:RRM domain-containing protein n=1 Tax=Absidia repens TaxID=90262 RepID=A0A1X2IGN5_9FUNG|nr:hypothetical protein BCR42DRAFT_353030 [Absidia repens]